MDWQRLKAAHELSGQMESEVKAAKRRGHPGRLFVGEGMKLCALCKTPKPVDEFCVDNSRSDGLSPRCFACRKLKNKYVPCQQCGGLRFGETPGLCRACYTKGGANLPPNLPEVKWKETWKPNAPRILQSIIQPPKLNGKFCENSKCGQWFTFKGKTSKRKACNQECAREIGRELARQESKLPYDFDLMYDLYWNQGLSTNQIGAKYGMKRAGANVHVRLRALGVPTRAKGKHFEQTECVIEGCHAPLYKVHHKTNGFYGRRCLEHWIAHRLQLRQDYWQTKVRWQNLGLDSSETLSEQIERLVPRSLPHEIRDEVCQELALKVMMREISVDELEQSAREYIRRFYNEYQSKFGALSLDAPIREGESFTLGDTIT